MNKLSWWSGLTDEQILEIAKSRQCGARTKTNNHQPCKLWRHTILCKNGKWRCKLHGGKSTGPKSYEGQLRSVLNIPRVARARLRLNTKPQDIRAHVSAC